MSDSDESQNDAQFGNTGGFQFVAYTLDVALWGAAMSLVLQYFHRYAKKDPLGIRLVVGIHQCKVELNFDRRSFSATNHILFYAVQNYKDFILLFGNYEAQNIIMFYASRIWMYLSGYSTVWYESVARSQISPVDISFVAAGIEKFLAMPGSFVFMLFILPSCQLYVISVCGMLISRESLLEELRGQNGSITTLDVTSAHNEETRRNFSGNSVNGAIHVVCSHLDAIPSG
ncbi:hypothetical protein K438DRAFT_1782177 [Mycena galopus ATCC 62051]|nr:hypothetical protein K438DRAFT_1782177 [Mycena galopus ATCC 62051]